MPSTAAVRMEKEGGRWLRSPRDREKLWWEAHAAWEQREREKDDEGEGERRRQQEEGKVGRG